jgi:peptidoglycan/LPS O-acetylase OafA/YrhL
MQIWQEDNHWQLSPYKKFECRPDIDGLRAFAITFVVIFYAFPEASSGGFIGVDVFFVISGLLVSGIIINETDKYNFIYKDFYERRVYFNLFNGK